MLQSRRLKKEKVLFLNVSWSKKSQDQGADSVFAGSSKAALLGYKWLLPLLVLFCGHRSHWIAQAVLKAQADLKLRAVFLPRTFRVLGQLSPYPRDMAVLPVSIWFVRTLVRLD